MGSERQAHNVTVNYCPSRLSKVVDLGTNRKRVYIFLLEVKSISGHLAPFQGYGGLNVENRPFFIHAPLVFWLKFGVFPLE